VGIADLLELGRASVEVIERAGAEVKRGAMRRNP